MHDTSDFMPSLKSCCQSNAGGDSLLRIFSSPHGSPLTTRGNPSDKSAKSSP